MALKQNTVLLAQLPVRLRGGDPGTLRSMWGRTELRNIEVGQGITDGRASVPSGNRTPSAWVLAYKNGGMASRNTIRGVASVTATGLAIPTRQPITASIAAGATVSANGVAFLARRTITGSIAAGASVTAVLRAQGTLSATINVNASQATATQIADAVWNKTLP